MISLLTISLIFVYQTNSATASAETNVLSRRAAASMPLCDSERPNSWATHRTLTIPESCIQSSAMEIAMANALCCVYTHVVVVAGDFTNRIPYLETYDGSIYAYGECSSSMHNDNELSTDSYTSVDVMQDVMGNVCGMSMGSRDCFDQSVCIEDAKTIPPPVDTVEPSAMPSTPSPTDSGIPTDIPTTISPGSDFNKNATASFSSSSPNSSSSSPSPSEALFSQPSWNTNTTTTATISLVSPLQENPSSGSLPLFSPAISLFKPLGRISSLVYFYSVCSAACYFLI